MPQPQLLADLNWGQRLDSLTIQRGLQELNPAITFDPVVNRPGDYRYTLDAPKRRELEAKRMPVLYNGRCVTALDRGIVPENKQWLVARAVVEVDWSRADEPDVSISYETVPFDADGYDDLWEAARTGRDHRLAIYYGNLIRLKPVGYKIISRSVEMVGWRHTFEALLRENIPGVTRSALNAKFGVDMYMIPIGADAGLALIEE